MSDLKPPPSSRPTQTPDAKEAKGGATPPAPPLPPLLSTPVQPAPSDRPIILMPPGEDHVAIAEAERILADIGEYFHMGGQLVRLAQKAGATKIEVLNEHTLYVILSAMIDWRQVSASV
ncbi:hypothetical protein WEU32_01085 [Brevundimonas sp. BH3]|uniref:hypothetical protein n=1 Tax=Brevundimonas sp. BH3 TaxID=3133089 RepID=UPI00324F5FA9